MKTFDLNKFALILSKAEVNLIDWQTAFDKCAKILDVSNVKITRKSFTDEYAYLDWEFTAHSAENYFSFEISDFKQGQILLDAKELNTLKKKNVTPDSLPKLFEKIFVQALNYSLCKTKIAELEKGAELADKNLNKLFK